MTFSIIPIYDKLFMLCVEPILGHINIKNKLDYSSVISCHIFLCHFLFYNIIKFVKIKCKKNDKNGEGCSCHMMSEWSLLS